MQDGSSGRKRSSNFQIARLTDPEAVNVRQYGGKISNLARLTTIGSRVPSGLALGKQVLAYFLSENEIDLAALDQIHSRGMIFLESALSEAQTWQERIVSTIRDGRFPPDIQATLLDELFDGRRYAVRSSCVVEDSSSTSFAGQYMTVLGVSGHSALLDAIRSCWSSQYDGRVLTYALSRRGMPVLIPSMAILIQEMLEPEFAGVCFSEGPTPRTRDFTIVESVDGIGEALVSGEKTPAHFEVAKDGSIHRALVNPATGKVPTENQIVAVADEAKRISTAFGSPQDIEWAIANDQLFLLQARPITVLGGQRTASIPTFGGDQTKRPSLGGEQVVATSEILRDDLHEWLIARIDPLVYRGAAYLLSKQHEDGSWKVEGHPEWDCVATALTVRLLLDGGVPSMLTWSLPGRANDAPALGVQAAIGWLVRNIKEDGSWGTDLWDTCQVIRALLRSGFTLDEPILASAFTQVTSQLARGMTSVAEQEWAGAGFLAVVLQLLHDARKQPMLDDFMSLLLEAQTAEGDFPAFYRGSRDPVPSEWHTAQAITALSHCCAGKGDVMTAVQRAQDWLVSRQHGNGSWGVSAGSYSHFNTFFTSYAIVSFSNEDLPRSDTVTKALRWLRGKQLASGAFGDIASSLMALSAFQHVRGRIFSLDMPIPLFLRIQSCLSKA